jgi:hypothetical protein
MEIYRASDGVVVLHQGIISDLIVTYQCLRLLERLTFCFLVA